MGRSSTGPFRVARGVMLAKADLRREDLDDFCQAARKLMSEPGPELLLDLTRTGFVFSSFVGVIGNLAQDCHNLGKRLTLRIPEKLAWVFKIDRNLDLFLRLETVKKKEEKK
jgi:anti-anti-sigma regulatory factor